MTDPNIDAHTEPERSSPIGRCAACETVQHAEDLALALVGKDTIEVCLDHVVCAHRIAGAHAPVAEALAVRAERLAEIRARLAEPLPHE